MAQEFITPAQREARIQAVIAEARAAHFAGQQSPMVGGMPVSAPLAYEGNPIAFDPDTASAPKRNQTPTPHRHRVGLTVGVFATLAAVVLVGSRLLPPSVTETNSGVIQDSGAQLPGTVTALGAEGLNAENCSGESAAVAHLTVEGYMPIRYTLNAPDGKTSVIPNTYMDAVAKAQNDPSLATKSGYPEVTAVGLSLYMNICETTGKAAVTGSTVNADGLTVTLTPENTDIAVQSEAYPSNLKASQHITVPPQSFIASNPSVYTDASLQAVNAVANNTPQADGTPDVAFSNQAKGLYNALLDSLANELGSADGSTRLNKLMRTTIYEVEQQALEKRLGSTTLTISGALPAPEVMHAIGDEKASNIAFDENGFVPTAVSVTLGAAPTTGQTPSATATTGGGSNS